MKNGRTHYIKARRQSGAGKIYCCMECGWQGGPLELKRGKIETAAGEAFSSKICPSCGRVGKSLPTLGPSAREAMESIRQKLQEAGVSQEEIVESSRQVRREMYLERRAEQARQLAEENGNTPEEELERLLDKAAGGSSEATGEEIEQALNNAD